MALCHNITSGIYVKKIYSKANPNMIYIPFFSSGDSHKTHTSGNVTHIRNQLKEFFLMCKGTENTSLISLPGNK